ncbi:ADP-ribosyl cyclase/cyclic ADP-ribose hydrolase isoform X4 [Hydra vulgaris]|uniref:ADP-ribosyl cyclase/cyclic ADP-ribose hydrolase isoform X4 n=2 Tax=Hydra vulgaris TaxID=6087 RepID=A0ABM4D794_HYDVU
MFFVFVVAILFLTPKFIESGGTTQNLKEIFIGRCWHYQVLAKENKIDELKTIVNCTKLWNEFYASFAFKNPCDVTKNSYKPFFEMLENPKKIRNAMFWSGSSTLVHQFTFINDQHIVLEETMTGYLMNELTWCGSPTTPDGLNYTKCNAKNNVCNAMYPAWFIASKKFAERAAGISHVLLNGSRPDNNPAYLKGSFFRSVEVPYLKIDKLIALVATNIGTNKREYCGSPSLRELEKDAAALNINFECVDQPLLVLRIYCLKIPQAPECDPKNIPVGNDRYSSSSEFEDIRLWKISCFTLVAVVASVLLFLGLSFVRKQYFQKHFTLNYSISSSKPIVNDV